MSLVKEDRVYFHGLDELRALAALMVFIHHLELFKFRENQLSLIGKKYFHHFVEHAGSNAVKGFFVLSGFLITYLLLKEKEKLGTIKIKDFYIRRILRIWPMYFLVIFIGFVLMPLLNNLGWFTNQHYYPKLIGEIEYASLPLYILFLSNIANQFYAPVAGAAQAWSVSVEEQFYLLWPNIIKYVNKIKYMVILVLALLVFKLLVDDVIVYFYGKSQFSKIVKAFSIQYMCVGSLAALFYYSKNIFIKFEGLFKSKITLVIVVLFIFVELAKFNHSLFLSFMFALLIILVVEQKIEIGFLKYLGKISYGLYMLHPFFIFISFSVAANFKSPIFFNVIFYSLSFGLTVLASGLSFKYFETPILKFKRKYTVIESGAK